MSQSLKVPELRHHCASGSAVVTVKLRGGARQDIYVGEYGSSKAREGFKKLVKILLTNEGIHLRDAIRSTATSSEGVKSREGR